jgi:hypothetical protein
MNCRITKTKSGKDYPKVAPGWGIIGRNKKWGILKGTKYMRNGLQFQANAIAYCGK